MLIRQLKIRSQLLNGFQIFAFGDVDVERLKNVRMTVALDDDVLNVKTRQSRVRVKSNCEFNAFDVTVYEILFYGETAAEK